MINIDNDTKEPHFGRLLLPSNIADKELDLSVYVHRQECHEKIVQQIISSYKQRTTGAIAICGSPGSGKSTIVRFLYDYLSSQKEFTPTITSIDFEDDVGFPQGLHPKPLLADHFASFFSRLERELVAAGSTLNPLREKIRPLQKRYKKFFENIKEEYPNNNQLEIAFDAVRDAIFPRIATIDKELVIFCDNLDFLTASDQIFFIGMLGMMTETNNKIKCVFTSRPLTTARIRKTFHDYLNKKLLSDNCLEDISVGDFLGKRFSVSDYILKDVFSIENLEIIRKLSAGNNQDILNNVGSLFNYYKKNPDLFPLNNQDMMRYLILVENAVSNPIQHINQDDEVPLKWVIMSFLVGKIPIDLSFYERLKLFIDSMTGKIARRVDRQRVESIIFEMIKGDYFIRRIDFINQEIDGRNLANHPERVDGSICCLTERGLLMFQSTKLITEVYPNFSSYRNSVRKFIGKYDTSSHKFFSENNMLGESWMVYKK